STADFEYRYGDGQLLLLIWDLDRGNKSVTNDVENVVADIAEFEDIDPCRCCIIYRDSMGIWSEWNAETKSFSYFPLNSIFRVQIKRLLDFDFDDPKPIENVL